MKSSPEAWRPPLLRGRVLKSADATSLTAAPVVIGSPRVQAGRGPERADRLLATARKAAADLLSGARLEAASQAADIRQAAFERGHTEGFAVGFDEGRAEGAAAGRAEAASLVADARRRAQELVAERETWVAQLALEVAAHLLGMELTLNPEAVERVVMTTLMEAEAGEVALAVSPDDFDQASTAARAWRQAVGGDADVRVDVDPSLPRGACRVTGPTGVAERNWSRDLVTLSELFERVSHDGV